jgi:Leucine-rich repeat (LRR) protein
LTGFTSLATLDLQQTDITDGAVVHLAKLKNLRNLNLGETEITSQGAGKLQALLPQCKISR